MRFITIDRDMWLTGQALANSNYNGTLLDAQTGMSDVIGQYLLEIGVQRSHLLNKAQVGDITCQLPSEAQWLLKAPGIASDLAEAIQAANDGPLHQTRKETKLYKLFDTQDVLVQFTGSYRLGSRRARAAFSQAA